MKKQHCLQTTLDQEGILTVNIDVKQESMNVFNQQVMEEFYELANSVDQDNQVKAVIFTSGKPDCFIAGADIKMLQQTQTAEEATAIVSGAHTMLQKINLSKKPFIAAIDGACIGAGYELALACDYRLASDSPTTKIGLPEVMIGVLPGATGTTKLSRLIDLPTALDMMLTGKQVSSQRAKQYGMLDEVVPKSILVEASKKIAHKLIQKQWQRKTVSLSQRIMKLPGISDLIINQARQHVLKKTRGLYPAPLAILEVIQYGLNKPIDAALTYEAEKFGELAQSPQAQQLMGLYVATTELKKETFVGKHITPTNIHTLGILGGGLMGAGIATVSIDKAGARVRMKDINDKGLLSAHRHINDFYKKRVKRRILPQEKAQKNINAFSSTLDYTGFNSCDLVIEAVFEDIDVKRNMVKDIESLENERLIFASNTSSIPIADIAQSAKRPENIIGMHYFSPVEKMPLLEIIKHESTSQETIASAVAFGKRQGKTVIVVKDSPGFYVNRILTPYLNTALELGMNGVPFDHIDNALVNFGFPVGPIKILDEVGIDIGSKILPILEQAFGDRMKSCGIQQQLLQKGRLGKKVKKGFYAYDGKHKGIDTNVYHDLGITPNKNMDEQLIIDTCIQPLLKEAQLCLKEGIIENERDGNIGAIFGIGFPPFLGGPFNYITSHKL